MKYLITFLAAFIWSFNCIAQNPDIKKVENKVAALGALPDKNVATIADTITAPFFDKSEKARAIFYWIANNIAIDPKATKNKDQKFSLPEDVIRLRKATPLGFAQLFQEMASQSDIRCLVVDGFTNSLLANIGVYDDPINNSWNVVQLGQSPDQWYYVDVAAAAGYLDEKQMVFTKEYNPVFFFTDKAVFNQNHYPDNKAWLLGSGARDKKDYYNRPIIYNYATVLGIKNITPQTGALKVKMNAPTSFSIDYNGSDIQKVELQTGVKKMLKLLPMNFTVTGNKITFSYTFKAEDEFPMIILIDGKPIAGYNVAVLEKLK